MIELSRRSLSWLCIAGFVLAAAGWTQAWRAGRALAETGGAAGPRDGRLERKSAARASGAAGDSALVSDPRSQRLVKWMAEMGASAEPGQPNPAFVKASAITLDDSLFHRRQRDFRLLMEKLRPEDARAIHDQFKALERDGRYFGAEYAAFAMRWGQIAGEEALNHWLETDRGQGNLVEFVTGWATADPEKALAWVKEHEADLGDANAYRPLLVGWINSDPVSAAAWLENANLPPGQVVDCVSGAVLDKIYSDGIEGASAWLASLPDDREEFSVAARQGWQAYFARQGNLDPQKAATAWGAVGSQTWMRPQDFQQFCGAVAVGNEGALDGFMEGLERAWPSGTVTAQFERWAADNPDQTAQAILALPASPVRTTATEAFLQTIRQADPDAVAAWQQKFGE